MCPLKALAADGRQPGVKDQRKNNGGYKLENRDSPMVQRSISIEKYIVPASEEGGLFATLKYRLESSDWLSGKETSSNNRMEDLEFCHLQRPLLPSSPNGYLLLACEHATSSGYKEVLAKMAIKSLDALTTIACQRLTGMP
ncbi:hypothetical protein RRG08_062343 [Elysia crispata]|uniref:Uncharacterized protein n=1 Tax=Elysia crispata TaxID=231223 RepID=A0AAE1CYU1_9GAST|nr:hypothetical protein RRG08_062343 [Elysia crispata]